MTQTLFKPLLLELLRGVQVEQNTFFQQLPETELTADGTPDHWSAKDHVAHMTFWRQRLSLRLQALISNEVQPEIQGFEHLNPLVFAENRDRPWPAILAESDQAYAELLALTGQLTEEDLTAPGRLPWVGDDMPLYTSFMGNCYEHTLNHLVQYLLDRHEDARAIETAEAGVRRVTEASAPDLLKGYLLYNLACFYATHDQLEKARSVLPQAFVLYPALREFALTDSDLSALRDSFS